MHVAKTAAASSSVTLHELALPCEGSIHTTAPPPTHAQELPAGGLQRSLRCTEALGVGRWEPATCFSQQPRSLSQLYYFNHYCTAFGFPSVGSEAAWAQAAEASTRGFGGGGRRFDFPHRQDSRRAFGDSRHFDKTTRLLQAEVKKRVETRLKEHLKLRTDPARIT